MHPSTMDTSARSLPAGSGGPLDARDAVRADALSEAWARSGSAGLCGRASRPPLGVSSALVEILTDLGGTISRRSARLGRRVDLDCLAMIGERAAIAGLQRNGTVSCGGATRLVPAADGWIAVSLARPSDIELTPAWLQLSTVPADLDDTWTTVERTVAGLCTGDVVERASLLGIPCSRLGELKAGPFWKTTRRIPVEPSTATEGAVVDVKPVEELIVVDLSSLWAGPLCANILGLAGLRVIKVESAGRPDGARLGPAPFYDLLHGGHLSVALDFADTGDVAVLRQLIKRADVVIEASRPRALQQLGIDALTPDGPAVWVSITGHGRTGSSADRVAFGDDAAVAGGLVTRDEAGPCFLGDAIADPLTGMLAAALTLTRLHLGGRWLLDLSLARTAAWAARGPVLPIDPRGIAEPRHRPVTAVAASMGRDTDAVLGELRISR